MLHRLRNRIRLCGYLLTAMAYFTLTTTVFAESARPNVLFIMTDDLRPQLGCYGDNAVKTPHLDQFAKKAIRFERAYVQCAICSPSRNSLLSGYRPHTTQLKGFGVKVRDRVPNVITLPEHFKNNGYFSKGIGKIFHIYVESMLGNEDDSQSWSVPQQLPTVPVWGPEQNKLRNRLIKEAKASGKQFNHPHDWPRARIWDDSDVPDDEMQDGQSTKFAEEFLENYDDDKQPFFLAVGFVRPHLPFNAPKKYFDLYDPTTIKLPTYRDLPEGTLPFTMNRTTVKNYYGMRELEVVDDAFHRKFLQAYMACISYVDACVGRLLASIKQNGFEDNTIVVFLGDHGYQMGEYDSWGHKHSNFEISTRAPLMMHVPGITNRSLSTTRVVEFLDIYPTVCELAGLKIPTHVEGKSMVPLIKDPMASHKPAAYSEMNRRAFKGYSVRTDKYRLTIWKNKEGKIVLKELYDHVTASLQPAKDASYNGKLEIKNVAKLREYKEVLQRHSELLESTFFNKHPKQ